jgi:hypothetical protein
MPLIKFLVFLGLLFLYSNSIHAGTETSSAASMDQLVAILVAKGVLTRAEAAEVLGELSRIPVDDLSVSSAESSWPEVAKVPERMRITGDLRLRAQTDDRSGLPDGSQVAEEAGEARYRWRLGVDVPVNDKWTVGFGLTSGGSDPRSTNQTFTNAFETYDARIDYAYTAYRFNDRLGVVGGKFDNPLWNPKDLLWDTDIRPEGILVSASLLDAQQLTLNLTSGGLILSDKEQGIRTDAYMWVAQLHGQLQLNDRWSLDLAPAYYISQDLQGTPGITENAVPTNSRDAQGNLLYDYDAATLSGALTWTPDYLVEQTQWFGELVRASDPDDDNLGWLAGVKFGDRQLDRLWAWQFSYNYRRLERDAWPEFLQDSDFLFGATGVKGGEYEFRIGLGAGTSIAIDYYDNNKFLGSDIEQDLLQLDLNLSW